jgi:ferric iron reductase protein FhuF
MYFTKGRRFIVLISEQEIKELKKYRLSTDRSDSVLSVRADQLMKQDSLAAYLRMVQQKMDIPNLPTTASMLMKRYSFLVVMTLYAMSVWDKRLHIQPENVWLETDDESEKWLPTFRLDKLECSQLDSDRQQWRCETIRILFANHIHPLIELLFQTTKLSKLILWENVAIYVFWLYETLLADEQYTHMTEKLLEDFHFVIQEARGELFGGYQNNPLSRFWKDKTYSIPHQKNIRIRTTCCLYYQTTKDGSRCLSCPLLCKS